MSVICPNPEDHVDYPEGSNRRGTCVKCGYPLPKPKDPEPAVFTKKPIEDEDDGPLEEGNTALRFTVGQRVTVHVPAGEFTGLIGMVRPDVIWVFSDSGSAWLRTAAIQSYSNLS